MSLFEHFTHSAHVIKIHLSLNDYCNNFLLATLMSDKSLRTHWERLWVKGHDTEKPFRYISIHYLSMHRRSSQSETT